MTSLKTGPNLPDWIALAIIWTAILFLLSGCSILPTFPEIWQCQFNGDPRAFYCVNTKTGEQKKFDLMDPVFKAAQCVSADDYKKVQQWISDSEKIILDRCQ